MALPAAAVAPLRSRPRLVAAGKANKLALTAATRKLVVLLHHLWAGAADFRWATA